MTTPSPIVPTPSDNWAGVARVQPVGMLAYSSIQGRPPLVTGLGVTSIVIAGLSMIAGLFSGLVTLPLLMAAAFPAAGPPAAAMAQTTPAGAITAEDADIIAAALAARHPLTATDQQALAQALLLVELPLAPPADGVWTTAHVASQISGTSSWTTGTTTSCNYTFTNGGTINVSAATVTVSTVSASGGWSTTTVTGGTVGATTTASFGMAGFDGSARLLMVAQAATTLLSVGLAVLLLVAGIQTVRGLPSGRTLHLWWAWPKLLVALFAAAAGYLFWNSMLGFGVQGAGGQTSRMAALAFAGIPLAMSMGWPVAVLLILRTRPLRAYYQADALA